MRVNLIMKFVSVFKMLRKIERKKEVEFIERILKLRKMWQTCYYHVLGFVITHRAVVRKAYRWWLWYEFITRCDASFSRYSSIMLTISGAVKCSNPKSQILRSDKVSQFDKISCRTRSKVKTCHSSKLGQII